MIYRGFPLFFHQLFSSTQVHQPAEPGHSETQDPTDVAEYQQRETNKLIEDGLLNMAEVVFLCFS